MIETYGGKAMGLQREPDERDGRLSRLSKLSSTARYKDSPELKQMLQFFIKANEQSYQSLLNYVEKGEVNPYQVK